MCENHIIGLPEKSRSQKNLKYRVDSGLRRNDRIKNFVFAQSGERSNKGKNVLKVDIEYEGGEYCFRTVWELGKEYFL